MIMEMSAARPGFGAIGLNSTTPAAARMITFAPSSLSSSGMPRILRIQRGMRDSPASEPRAAAPRRVIVVIARSPSLHDESGDHAKHPVIGFGVGKNVAMEGPRSRIVAVDDHVPPFAGRDVEGVAFPRGGHRPAVLGDDGHVHPVEMHGVDHHPFVHEADANLLTLLRHDWLGRGKALAV